MANNTATATPASSSPTNDNNNNRLVVFLLFAFVTILRILIGFHPHSGQDNHHGSKTAYGGDFEAQRHWMELTLQLPIGDWYYYDLQYWGLDYPPLTAYVSYVCGWISHHLVGPESVALLDSRGIEDPIHKAYMRATVLVLDLLLYGSAVWYATRRMTTTTTSRDTTNTDHQYHRRLWTVLIAMSQPAILLIDHGHFQYNTVALGLAIASFSYMVQAEFFYNCIFGSIFFCLALNFKQMTLYYAPAIFCYLLGRCLQAPKNHQSSSSKAVVFASRFLTLGMTVIITFGILWTPFLMYGPSDQSTTVLERLFHVLRRIFPLERGLFEGKVSNFWCALSIKPIQIRDRIDPALQPVVALLVTILLMMPSCVAMLRLGMQTTVVKPQPHNNNNHWSPLLWATTSCSLSFFLASFQVHEKSILLALAPCTFLLWEDAIFVEWFSIVCVWTLWPLLQVDRLHVAYGCILIIFACLLWVRRIIVMGKDEDARRGVFSPGRVLRFVPPLSYLGMMGLHVTERVVDVPFHLPDLFELLWSVAGCGMFGIAWLVTCWKLLSPAELLASNEKAKIE
jgi:alpha-1,3-glucosyltransferase